MSALNCITNGGAPELNADIAGIGVRTSFYLQALFLVRIACLSLRSGSMDEIEGALYTLVATNMAMAVTSLILGLRLPETIRGMSLQDGLIVLYLLAISWFAVYASLLPYSRFLKGDKTLKLISVIQSYFLFAFALTLLIKAKDFGSNPECNQNAKLVIFGQFLFFNVGRVVGGVVAGIITIVYTYITLGNYKNAWNRQTPGAPEAKLQGQFVQATLIDEPNSRRNPEMMLSENAFKIRLVMELILFIVIWALMVLNTELLRLRNHFEPSEDPAWTFGQILPMFLVILPLISVFKAFRKHGFKPRKRRVLYEKLLDDDEYENNPGTHAHRDP